MNPTSRVYEVDEGFMEDVLRLAWERHHRAQILEDLQDLLGWLQPSDRKHFGLHRRSTRRGANVQTLEDLARSSSRSDTGFIS